MRKFFSIAIASLLIVSSFASCGENSESSTSSASSSESAAVTEAEEETAAAEAEEETTTEEAATTAADEEESATTTTSEESSDSAETTTSSADSLEDFEITTIEMPEIKPDAVAEADFVGKWECTKLIVEGIEQDNFMGIPLSVMFQIEIKEDHTANMASSLADETESDNMTWEYSDNKIILTDISNETTDCVISGGELILAEEVQQEQVYFKKVDEFTKMSDEELQALMDEAIGQMGIEIDDSAAEDSNNEGTDSAQ